MGYRYQIFEGQQKQSGWHLHFASAWELLYLKERDADSGDQAKPATVEDGCREEPYNESYQQSS